MRKLAAVAGLAGLAWVILKPHKGSGIGAAVGQTDSQAYQRKQAEKDIDGLG